MNVYEALLNARPRSRWQKVALFKESSVGGGGFPGGSVVKNPPASAGDMSSIPGSGEDPTGN